MYMTVTLRRDPTFIFLEKQVIEENDLLTPEADVNCRLIPFLFHFDLFFYFACLLILVFVLSVLNSSPYIRLFGFIDTVCLSTEMIIIIFL